MVYVVAYTFCKPCAVLKNMLIINFEIDGF